MVTRCKVYRTMELPAQLFSSEIYTLYRRKIKHLEEVQHKRLRRIMKKGWSEYISNVKVLRRAGLDCVEAVLATSKLR